MSASYTSSISRPSAAVTSGSGEASTGCRRAPAVRLALLFHHCVRVRIGRRRSRRAEHRELGHLPLQGGDDLFGGGRADAGERRKPACILPADGVGDLLDRPGHCLQRLLHADLLDGAEQLEELQLGLGVEADPTRHEAAAGGVAFKIFTNVEGHFLAAPQLDVPAHRFRHEHLILERTDFEPYLIVEHLREYAGHLGYHADSLRVSGVMSSGSSPSRAFMFTPVKVAARAPPMMLLPRPVAK